MPLTFTAPAPAPRQLALDGDPLTALAACMADFRLCGLTAAAMVARLDAALVAIDTVPVADWARWQRGASLWVCLRRGPLPHPLPPRVWPFARSLAGQVHHGHTRAVRCRAAWLALDTAGARAAVARYGALRGPERTFGALWAWGIPQARIDALDARSAMLRVETPPERQGGTRWRR